MDEGKVLAREIAALAEKATPGPFDCMPGYLVRAIRGDMAVPIFETRDVHFDPAITKAPTVRGGDGKVLFRANSEGARISQAERWNHANAELVTLLLNNLPTILSALSAAPSEEVVAAGVRAFNYGVWGDEAACCSPHWIESGVREVLARAAISSMGGLGEVDLGQAWSNLEDAKIAAVARKQALEEAAKVARQVEQSRRHWHRSNYGSRTGLDQAEGAGMVATAIEALIQPRGEGNE